MTASGPVPNRLLTALQRGPLVMDAAMGTRLRDRGLDLRTDDPCLWNLTHPIMVRALHRRDVRSGSQVVFTNTFGANRSWLSKYGESDAVAAINRRAVELARQAAGPARFVVGAIGPSAAERAGAATEQAAVLVEAGVDALVFETFLGDQVEPVLRDVQARLASATPLLVSLWQWPDPPDSTARRLLDLGAAVLGLNCQQGVAAALRFAQRLGSVVACPLLVKPSAEGADRPESDSSPASFAAAAPRLVERNVRLLGGCCGTTEAHIAALANACALARNHSLTERPGAGR